ncbi:MAG: heavy-metal-associated domain-containing protein [Chitinophagales bacterium]|jgi:copper chaperone CopZ|nr:heavy-metal-associated domain-containing protein [Chitinophagales bacterium]
MKVFQILLVFLLAIITYSFVGAKTFPQANPKPKWKTVVIQTSAQCGMCKERIEGALSNTAGIRFANLNLGNKKMTVKYDSRQLTADKVREVIVNTGYNADTQVANPEAYQNLPACCKIGGH